jgi:hypothetical protein
MRLTSKDTEDKKLQYGMWLGLPPDMRQEDVKTQKDFAKKIGLKEETISRWKDDPYVKSIRENAVRIWGGNDKLEIIKSIIAQAKEGKVAAQRLYLEWQGELDSRQRKEIPSEFTVTYKTEE